MHTLSDTSTSASEKVVQAAQADHWREVALVSSECITRPIHHSTLPTSSDFALLISWWHIRLVSLWKLHFFAQLHNEMESLWKVLESVQVYNEHRTQLVPLVESYHVPFALHVFHAQEKLHNGEREQGVELMWKHLQFANRKANETSTSNIWQTRAIRVTLLLASLLIERDEISAADTLVQSLVVKLDASNAKDPVFLLALARLFWEIGDHKQASAMLNCARSSSVSEQHDMHAALVHHCVLGEYLNQPHMEPTALSTVKDFESSHVCQSLTNTMSMEAFFQGQIGESIRILEQFLHAHPTTFATSSSLASNLLTLHSLSSNDVKEEKQRVVRFLVQWAGDDPSCVHPR